MDVLEAFDSFRLETRSATLDGSAPLRAVQGCRPFLDGNEAGLHLQFRYPAMLVCREGQAKLRLSEKGRNAATKDYAARVEELVAAGHLTADGYWHRQLQMGFVTQEGETLRVWTGYLVKPASDVWILVSTAYNRRCMVDVREYILSDTSAFVPLFVELDLSTLSHEETWLDTELATLTALRPNVRVQIRSLREDPEPGQRFVDFFSAESLERRATTKVSGDYRQKTAHLPDEETPGAGAVCGFAYCGGQPHLLSAGRFERFLTAGGMAENDPAGRTLEYGVTHALYDLHFRWAGVSLRVISRPSKEDVDRLMEEWSELYGTDPAERIRFWSNYMMPSRGPQRGEPYLTLSGWVLARTPPGWSSILDAYSFPDIQGMRGVIAHDTYPGALPQFQFCAPGEFRMAAGTPVGRNLPVPRSLLQAGYRNVSRCIR